MGPNYANLFVGHVEEQIFNQFDGPKPETFGRHMDDCLGATSCTKEELERFIGFVNSFHPALKFTWEISETSVTFLEINISVQDNNLATSVHYESKDSHSYLLYSSSNSSHVKDSMPCSQFLRLRRLCSDDSDFNSMKCLISFPNAAILTSYLKHLVVSKTSIDYRQPQTMKNESFPTYFPP